MMCRPPTTDQWTCFHCGETFTTRETAHAHFGDSEIDDAACRLNAEEGGIAAKLRDAEHELHRYRVEDSDMDRKFYAMSADHQAALRRAEEDGYGKGVRDVGTERQRALEEAADKIDGLEADLDSAIDVMIKRVSGEADVLSMGVWLLRNYKDHPRVRALAKAGAE